MASFTVPSFCSPPALTLDPRSGRGLAEHWQAAAPCFGREDVVGCRMVELALEASEYFSYHWMPVCIVE